MSKKMLLTLPLLLILIGVISPMYAMTNIDWESLSNQTWDKYKANYIYCGQNCMDNGGLVFDPSADYHAVSEGVGYGLLLATIFDDQATFDHIFFTAQRILRDEETGLHHWRANNQGHIIGYGSATDAELDIATALILADGHVQRGQWVASEALHYGDEARTLLDAIWTHEVVDDTYLKPGNRFQGGGQDIINLSYFAPAWFRLYDSFLGETRWTNLITPGYQALNATEGSALGLAPDWSTFDGQPAYTYCDDHDRPRENCSYDMGYDAIRVPWRIGMDCILYNDERACEWSQRSTAFLNTQVESRFARLYTMTGDGIVDYRDEAMLGMWLFAVVASHDDALQTRIEWQIYNLAKQSNDIWAGHESYYYNQSLVLFAMSFLANKPLIQT